MNKHVLSILSSSGGRGAKTGARAQNAGLRSGTMLRKVSRALPWAALGSVALVGVLGAVAAEMTPRSADATTSQVSATLNSVEYTLDVTAQDVEMEVETTPAGTFNYAQGSVSVSTNAEAGYKLYLSMNNDTANGNRLYKTVDDVVDSTNYIEATTEQANKPDMNSWGYSTDYNTSSNTGTWKPVKLLSSPELINTNTTSNPSRNTISGTATVFYGVNASTAKPNGTYQNSVLYTATAEVISAAYAKVDINDGADETAALAGGDTMTVTTSLMTNMTLTTDDVSLTIGGNECTTNKTVDQSHGFLQVSCTTPAKAAGTYAVVVTIDKFDKTYTIANGIIYAAKFWNIAYMQDMTTAICSELWTPSNSTSATYVTTRDDYATKVTANNQAFIPQRTLIDKRDNKPYYVKKLADGNCWMDQNLDLDLGTPTTTANSPNTTFKLTSELTDINYNNYKNSTAASANEWTPPYNTQLSSGTSWAQNASDGAKSFTFNDNGTIDVKTGGTAGRYWNGASSYTETGNMRNHFGNYYNWPAATAGTGTSSVSTDGTTVGDSICPKGWQLPLNANNKSFNNLIRTVYGISATNTDASVIAEPLHFIRSGGYSWNGGSLNLQGAYGNFWSAAAKDGTNAYNLNFNSSNLNPQNTNNKGNGLTVRCVAR